MKYTIDKHDRYVVIMPLSSFLNGEVATKLKGEFLLRNTSGQRNIVLDLSQVGETDEDGIRMGIMANRICKSVGGIFVLIGVNEQILNFMKMTHLDRSFIIAKNQNDAEDLIFNNEVHRKLRGGS